MCLYFHGEYIYNKVYLMGGYTRIFFGECLHHHRHLFSYIIRVSYVWVFSREKKTKEDKKVIRVHTPPPLVRLIAFSPCVFYVLFFPTPAKFTTLWGRIPENSSFLLLFCPLYLIHSFIHLYTFLEVGETRKKRERKVGVKMFWVDLFFLFTSFIYLVLKKIAVYNNERRRREKRKCKIAWNVVEPCIMQFLL